MGSSASKWKGQEDGGTPKKSKTRKAKVHQNPKKEEKSNTDEKSTAKEEEYKFVLSDQTEEGITRMDFDREMLIGMWFKNRVSHSSVFTCYFSKITETSTQKVTLTGRTFAIELFINTDTKENVLSIKGPVANTREYKCSEFYIIETNMNELIEISKTTMNAHGKYDYLRNNCRHFSNSFLMEVKEKCVALSVDVPSKTITEYLHEYGSQKAVFPSPYLRIGDDGKIEPPLMVPPTTDEVDDKEDKEVEALSFLKVLKQFPLDKQ